MANSTDVMNIPIRLASSDYELQQLKKLAKIKKVKFTPLLKYVLLCNILGQTPKSIAKVFPSTDTKPVSFILYVSATESNGVLYDWFKECQEKKIKNLSTYIKNLVKNSITICDNEEEQEISDIYWEYVKLEQLNSNSTLRMIPKEFNEKPNNSLQQSTNANLISQSNHFNNVPILPSTEVPVNDVKETSSMNEEPPITVSESVHEQPLSENNPNLSSNENDLHLKVKGLTATFKKNYLT